MSLSTYTDDEWLLHKTLIEDLYSGKRFTMEQISDHLWAMNFRVNARMVKTRIINWDLHKRLQYAEVRTAFEILGPERSTWPSQCPQFRIRKRTVSFDEMLRFCRRKGIKDPVKWFETAATDDYVRSPHVELLLQSPSQENFELRKGFRDQQRCDDASDDRDLAKGASIKPQSSAARPAQVALMASSYAIYNSEPIHSIKAPEIFTLAAAVVAQTRSYCLSYISSAHESAHQEPIVHQFTSHARFQSRIQEGLALLERNESVLAFRNFEVAFILLKDLLMDFNPMVATVYLLTLCMLNMKSAQAVAIELVRHTIELTHTIQHVPASLAEIFRAIRNSRDFLDFPLLCLQAVSDTFVTEKPNEWKAFYVQERHCDALYYAHLFGEAASRRAKLLPAQESFYGASARNVLWTSLNVADDHFTFHRWKEAEMQFSAIMLRSSQLTGFHRAKVQVVALEGLAKILLIKSGRAAFVNPEGNASNYEPVERPKLLQQALEHTEQALELAQMWFESPSRRIERVRGLRNEVMNLVIGQPSNLPSHN